MLNFSILFCEFLDMLDFFFIDFMKQVQVLGHSINKDLVYLSHEKQITTQQFYITKIEKTFVTFFSHRSLGEFAS